MKRQPVTGLPVRVFGTLPQLVNKTVSGTFEETERGGMLHLGTTYPSSGTRRQTVRVSAELAARAGIRPGDVVTGLATAGKPGGMPALEKVETINELSLDRAAARPDFLGLVPVYPDERLALFVPGAAGAQALRDIDSAAPIGKGTRGLITAPAGSGKTRLLNAMAASLERTNPELRIFMLLVGRPPVEAAAANRQLFRAEVIHSSCTEDPRNHTRAAVTIVEKAKRLVEMGEDVAVLIDGMTDLADACEMTARSGSLSSSRWINIKTLFGAARNIENGGSLTILATADERQDNAARFIAEVSSTAVYFQPGLRDGDHFPAIDRQRSWSRRDDLLRGHRA